jgi:cobalt-zinc-cadmium efflux system outer membrane protein
MSDRFRGCARSLTAVAAAVLATGSPNVFAQSRAPLPVAPAASAQADALTLDQAIALALNAAPEAAANAARLDALRAAQRQAGVRPNPVLDIAAENGVGTGPYRFGEGIELTATYAQTIERGGRRQARVALAGREIDVAEAEALVQRLDIARRVQTAFVEAMTAEAMVGVVTERLRLARSLRDEINRRVRAARDPLFAGTRAEIRVSEAEVDLELAEQARDAAMARLAAWWGGSARTVIVSIDDFFMLDRPEPVISDAISAVDLAVHESRVRRAEAAVRLEQSRRVQDPTIRGGARYLNGTGDVALVGGISIPLARHDTNRGNIERAEAERRRAEADSEVARTLRMRELALARQRVQATRREAEALLRQVFPLATRSLDQVRAGFARGGFRHSDLDEAATRVNTVRERMVRAASDYHQARIEVDRLTGRFARRLPLEEIRP